MSHSPHLHPICSSTVVGEKQIYDGKCRVYRALACGPEILMACDARLSDTDRGVAGLGLGI